MNAKAKTNAARRGFRPAAQNWVPRRARAKMVGELIPALMRPTFEKFGFPAAAILTDWAAIAGPEFAAFTAPERLKWPRSARSADENAAEPGATLILRVSGAHALEVEHLRPLLIERINAMFGYRAVSDIRIVQAPLPRAKAEVRPVPRIRIGRTGRPHRRSARRPPQSCARPHGRRDQGQTKCRQRVLDAWPHAIFIGIALPTLDSGAISSYVMP